MKQISMIGLSRNKTVLCIFLVIIVSLLIFHSCITSKKSEISLPGVLKAVKIDVLDYKIIGANSDSVILEVEIKGKILHSNDSKIGNVSFIHVAEDDPTSKKEVINIWLNESLGSSAINNIEYQKKKNTVIFEMAHVHRFKLRKGTLYILKCANKQKKIIF